MKLWPVSFHLNHFRPWGLKVNNVFVLLDHLLLLLPAQRVDDFNNIWFSVRAVHSFI